MVFVYNKLIRDNLVEIMEKKGCKVKYKVLNDKDYLLELEKSYLKKLMNF